MRASGRLGHETTVERLQKAEMGRWLQAKGVHESEKLLRAAGNKV
jgi:hypothetical protein